MAPWLEGSLAQLVEFDRVQASPILLHGLHQQGIFEMVTRFLSLAVCENPISGQACMRCPGCQIHAAGNHPDVQHLLPQDKVLEMGFHVDIKTGTKPSREIRIDEIRALQAFVNTAASRGGRRYLVVYPFEALNAHSANALLKSLEEPTNELVYLLVGQKANAVLATVRSRCRVLHVPSSNSEQAIAWLASQGVVTPEIVLSLAGNNPFEALSLSRDKPDELGIRKRWVEWLAHSHRHAGLPVGAEKLSLGVLLQLSARLCDDLMHIACEVKSPHFPWLHNELAWAKSKGILAISKVYCQFQRQSACVDHPINPRLALEFLMQAWQTGVSR